MTRIDVLLRMGSATFRVALKSNDKSLNGIVQRPCRRLWLSQILLAGIAALWGTTAVAQSHTVYVQPLFLYCRRRRLRMFCATCRRKRQLSRVESDRSSARCFAQQGIQL